MFACKHPKSFIKAAYVPFLNNFDQCFKKHFRSRVDYIFSSSSFKYSIVILNLIMDHREEFTVRETTAPTGVACGPGIACGPGVGMPAAHVEQKGQTKIKNDATGATQKINYERKDDVGGGGKFEYHAREDLSGGGGRKVDYERKDDPVSGTHKVDYSERTDEKDEGMFSKAARKIGLKD